MIDASVVELMEADIVLAILAVAVIIAVAVRIKTGRWI